MKKLRLIAIILLVIVFFVGCKKTGDKEDSDIDSLKNVENVTISDTSLIIEDNKTDQISQPIEEDIPDTTSLVKEDDWEYEKLKEGNAVVGGRINLENLPVQSRVKGLSRSSVDLGSVDLGSGSISSSRVAKQSHSASAIMSDGLAMNSSDALGFSVGGAKDINNFRENIKNNYMPVEEDITHEGIFYDYFFDNNITKQAKHLFEPAYTSYKNRHPLTNEEELYLSVGLNSNLSASSFKRKKLNLTIVLDISGSMNSKFDRHNRNAQRSSWDNRSKIEIAKECMIDLTKHLNENDRLAVVLFNWDAHLAKPFNLLNKTNMEAIRSHIREIKADGSTNMYDGFTTATELYDKLPAYDTNEYDNRIIFLTDAMPNESVTDKNTIWGLMKTNATQKVYTTFIGVGIDLNSELINYITKTPGANYYSVHNAEDFKKRMDTQFDFMVTPLVFDLTLHLKSNNYEIEKVYGAPEADQATGEIMKINTLFPSETENGKTRGGIILIKLKKTGNDSDLELRCSYKDRNGIPDFVSEKINFSKDMKGTDNGIRKAVLLSRYVNLMHDWIENKTITVSNAGVDDWLYGESPEAITNNTSWKRRSSSLSVNSYYQEVFKRFKTHFNSEAKAINDEDLKQESDILEFLIDENRVAVNNPVKDNEILYRRKEEAIRRWFYATMIPQINQEYHRYNLRKSVSGKLNFTLIFKDDIVIKAIIRGIGSIDDKEFINRLNKIIEGRVCPGIGIYNFAITENFE